MENNKQTAVEWFFNEIKHILPNDFLVKYEQAKEMEKQQRQIELPSDEDIKEYVKSTGYYGYCTHEYHEGIEEGAKWMRDKIQGCNK